MVQAANSVGCTVDKCLHPRGRCLYLPLLMPMLLHRFQLLGQQLQLLPTACLYWQEQQMLVLADVHLGKATHFRKAGIAVPPALALSGLHKLSEVIDYCKPESVVVVGDLFHSHANAENDLFVQWRQQYAQLPIHLVMGNHDVLPMQVYQQSGITVHAHSLLIPPFELVHQPPTQPQPNRYYLSGHVHPAVRLKGSARQKITLPCFHFGAQVATLPAFGSFTGLHVIRTHKHDAVFAIAHHPTVPQIMPLQQWGHGFEGGEIVAV